MKIEFYASKVTYNEALGGEIVQVNFEEEENDDPFKPTNLYLHISANYEFGSSVPSAQWFDGRDEDGGIDVEFFNLNQNEAQIHLKNSHKFIIRYSAAPSIIEKIRSFLSQDCTVVNA